MTNYDEIIDIQPNEIKYKDFTIVNGILYEYSGNSKVIVIPDGVTEIIEGVFVNNHNITKITLPEGLVKIGDYAFCCCTSLKDMNIPDSVEEIGNEAFFLCQSLEKTIELPNIKKIGERAFFMCSNATIIFPKNCKYGNEAFACTKHYVYRGK